MGRGTGGDSYIFVGSAHWTVIARGVMGEGGGVCRSNFVAETNQMNITFVCVNRGRITMRGDVAKQHSENNNKANFGKQKCLENKGPIGAA